MPNLPTFNGTHQRSIWVQGELRLKGTSFSDIARQNGWSSRAVSAAMYVPSDPQERAIAEALGVTQQELFPERFGEDGRRLHRVRESTDQHPQSNAKKRAVA